MGGHGRVSLFDQLKDVFDRDIHLPRLGQQGVDTLGQNLETFAACERRALVRDVRPGGAAFFHDAGRFQLAVPRATVLGLINNRSARTRIGGSSAPGRRRPEATWYLIWFTICR